MKRNHLFLLLTLTMLFSVLPSQARAMEDYSENYWTLDEIMALREEAKQEVLDYCQYSEEFDCAERYHAEAFYERGTNYQAVDNINIFRFLITAVNPAENTVRLLFIDDDMENYYMTGELLNDNIDELYMVWFDYGWLGYSFYYDYQTGTLPSQTHHLFAKDSLATSFPPKEEITFELEGDVSENYRNMIYYYFITTSGNRYMDPIDYNSCVNHPDYHEGMECRLFFDKINWGNLVYLPVEIETSAPAEPETIPEPKTILEPEIPVPLTPDTGAESLKCERRIEFPWWMYLLIAGGEIVTIYCLLPNFKKYRQKHQK